MTEYTVQALSPLTWDAYADLIERHNGIWGGCWCLNFHPNSPERGISLEGNRALKKRLVEENLAHAAVVFDGERAVGWSQFGPPEELPNITHRKEYEAIPHEPADYWLTCFFVDRDYRRDGVAAAALQGALDLIAESGGGLVEAFPYDVQKKVSGSFLYNGTRDMFERAGFEYLRHKGKNHCVMTRRIAAS